MFLNFELTKEFKEILGPKISFFKDQFGEYYITVSLYDWHIKHPCPEMRVWIVEEKIPIHKIYEKVKEVTYALALEISKKGLNEWKSNDD